MITVAENGENESSYSHALLISECHGEASKPCYYQGRIIAGVMYETI